MPPQLDEQLRRSRSRLRTKHKLASLLRQAQDMECKQRRKLAVLQRLLSTEQADVKKLEGLTLTNLFQTVLGNKEEALQKERQEYLAVKLKHDAAAETLHDASAEIQRLRGELVAFDDAERDHERWIDEKATWIATLGGETAATLMRLGEELADRQSDHKELQEALAAGRQARASLRSVIADIQSALKWGARDMMDVGWMANSAKYAKIDSAQDHAQKAQMHLLRFQRELVGAGKRLRLALKLSDFERFADRFIDGLIFDWAVQAKIEKAASICSSTMSRLKHALQTCEARLVEAKREMDRVAQRDRS